MAEPVVTDVFAFVPHAGGIGKRITCIHTASTSAAIPGTQSREQPRLCISNGGAVSAFVRFGQSGVVATLDCMEILPRTQVVIGQPDVSPDLIYMAAITESGSTKVQVTAGRGV